MEDPVPGLGLQDVGMSAASTSVGSKAESFPFSIMDQSNAGLAKSKATITKPMRVVKERTPSGLSVANISNATSSVDLKTKAPEGSGVAINLPGTITIPLSAMSGLQNNSGMTINLTPSSLGSALNLGTTRLPGGTVNLTMTLVSNKNVQLQASRNCMGTTTGGAGVVAGQQQQQLPRDVSFTISQTELAALQGKSVSPAVTLSVPQLSDTSGVVLAENGQLTGVTTSVRTCANAKKVTKPARVKPRSPGIIYTRASGMPALTSTGLIFDTAVSQASSHGPSSTLRHVTSVRYVVIPIGKPLGGICNFRVRILLYIIVTFT